MLPQGILALAETRLSHTSSAAVCRKLSSVGRRVLSIESVSTFQGHFIISIHKCHCLASAVCSPGTNCSLCMSTDGPEGSWEARWQHPKPRCLLKRLSSDDNTKDLCVDNSVKANGLSRQQVCDKSVAATSFRKLLLRKKKSFNVILPYQFLISMNSLKGHGGEKQRWGERRETFAFFHKTFSDKSLFFLLF